jgi:nicotinate-nucleotide--dimethylbenzimidazole phosphoribosyltransferase
MSDPRVLRHVIESITPASAAHGEGARLHLVAAGMPVLERLAITVGAAQHTARPRSERRTIIVACGDHGVGDPGIALGASHPTIIAAHAIADGSAALSQVARASRAPIVIVDAGARESASMPATAVALGRGPSRNLMHEPAMTVVDAALGLEAGIALAVSLADDGLDVLALGAIGVGSDVSSMALLGAALGTAPTWLRPEDLGDPAGRWRSSFQPQDFSDPVAESAGVKGAELAGAGGIELLAAFGGPETAVLAGVILAAASMNVPIVLDGYATGAAALVAAALAHDVAGYLVAAHVGTFTQPRILAHLGLTPVFEVGLGHGEGTGAAMVLPLLDQVAALTARG